ncbi:MAG: hypothetical protein WBA24_12310 [Geitlerinemataceae cyanobacterium]
MRIACWSPIDRFLSIGAKHLSSFNDLDYSQTPHFGKFRDQIVTENWVEGVERQTPKT